jgi:hypothetical protein
MVIRVIHVCRRIGGEWKLVPWHAGFPPTARDTAPGKRPAHPSATGQRGLPRMPVFWPAGHELLRSRRCSRSWAASSISLCRHSAARYWQAIIPIRCRRRKSPYANA